MAAGLTPEATALWRYLVPAVLLLPWTRGAIRHRRAVLKLFAAGLCVGVAMAFFFRAVDTLGVATASIIYYVYPALTLLIARLVYGEALGPRRALAALLAMAGAALALGPSGLAGAELSAAALCALAPLAFAVLLNLIAQAARATPFMLQVAPVLWGCVTALAPLAYLADGPIAPADATTWAMVLAIGAVAMLLPALLTTYALGRVGAGPVGVISALELPAAMLVAWAWLAQTPSLTAGCGALLIVAGAAVASARPRRADADRAV